MKRIELSHLVSQALGDQRLVWVGTRGDDAESIADLPQFTAAISIISRYRNRSKVESLALEDLTGVRVDLDTFYIDEIPRDQHIAELRRALLRLLARPSCLITYRPSTFTSAVCFARRDRCRYLGLFGGHQAAFEHKPWVETSLADLSIPNVGWTYIADDDQLDAERLAASGPIMLRRSRTTGGVGLTRIDDPSKLESLWPAEDEAYVSVSPYIEQAVPVNVGAVVWDDGVTVHPASVQLIGIEGFTDRPFGYCGNDFGAITMFPDEVLDTLESYIQVIGKWLHGNGYRGAFGADFLVREGEVLFMEVNPRFQGSTHASCQISTELDESGLMLEHLAAFAGIPCPPSRSLKDFARNAEPLAHFVVHAPQEGINSSQVQNLIGALSDDARLCRIDVALGSPLLATHGALVARVTVRDQLTTTGFDLATHWKDRVVQWKDEVRA